MLFKISRHIYNEKKKILFRQFANYILNLYRSFSIFRIVICMQNSQNNYRIIKQFFNSFVTQATSKYFISNEVYITSIQFCVLSIESMSTPAISTTAVATEVWESVEPRQHKRFFLFVKRPKCLIQREILCRVASVNLGESLI